jgi:hypothetical protein
MDDYKKRVQAALLNFHDKAWKKMQREMSPKERKKRNAKPEKEVETACLTWMRALGWAVEIYESKATFDPRTGHYRQQSMKAGTCDCMGLMPNGTTVAIEFKAPGRLKTFLKESNQRQIDFILTRIEMNAFACVVDSVDRLKAIYEVWTSLKDRTEAKQYLFDMLPGEGKC